MCLLQERNWSRCSSDPWHIPPSNQGGIWPSDMSCRGGVIAHTEDSSGSTTWEWNNKFFSADTRWELNKFRQFRPGTSRLVPGANLHRWKERCFREPSSSFLENCFPLKCSKIVSSNSTLLIHMLIFVHWITHDKPYMLKLYTSYAQYISMQTSRTVGTATIIWWNQQVAQLSWTNFHSQWVPYDESDDAVGRNSSQVSHLKGGTVHYYTRLSKQTWVTLHVRANIYLTYYVSFNNFKMSFVPCKYSWNRFKCVEIIWLANFNLPMYSTIHNEMRCACDAHVDKKYAQMTSHPGGGVSQRQFQLDRISIQLDPTCLLTRL